MKKRTYILTFLILVAFIRLDSQIFITETKSFCENEYLLFNGFDKGLETEFSLFKFRTDTKLKLNTLEDNINCRHFNLCLNFELENETIISLNTYINYLIDCENPPPTFNPRHFLNISLIGTDSLYIEREFIDIENVKDIVLVFYQSKNQEDFKNTYISIYWENIVSENVFQKTISQCLNAYKTFISNKSIGLYGLNTCLLNREQLRELYAMYPFKLRADFYPNNIHFLSIPIPPEPPLFDNELVR